MKNMSSQNPSSIIVDNMSSSDKSTAFLYSDLNYNSGSGRSNQSLSMSISRPQSLGQSGAAYSSGTGSISVQQPNRYDSKSQPPNRNTNRMTLNQIISNPKVNKPQYRRRQENNYLETINSEKEHMETEGGTSSILENTRGLFSYLSKFRFQ